MEKLLSKIDERIDISIGTVGVIRTMGTKENGKTSIKTLMKVEK